MLHGTELHQFAAQYFGLSPLDELEIFHDIDGMSVFREHLEAQVTQFLARHSMAPSRLGKEFNGDPHLLHRFLNERKSMTIRTADKLLAWMAAYDARSALETDNAA